MSVCFFRHTDKQTLSPSLDLDSWWQLGKHHRSKKCFKIMFTIPKEKFHINAENRRFLWNNMHFLCFLMKKYAQKICYKTYILTFHYIFTFF